MNQRGSAVAWVIVIVIIALLGAIGYLIWNAAGPGKLDVFARCLKEKQAVFYGAFWCPHCQNQKA